VTALRRVFALVAIAVGLVGLGINFQLIMSGMWSVTETGAPPRGPAGTFVYFWSFFTHLTNLWLLLCYVSELTGWKWLGWLRHPVGRASMAGSITLVMVFYHFMLAPNYHFEGGLLVSNILMHYLAPLLYLVWWAALSGHGALRLRDVPTMLLPGILYLVYSLVRGAIVSEYPYDIIDVTKVGYGGVAIGAGILIVLVAIFCVVLVGLDRLLGRQRTVPA
jgi:hypothetical protein